MLLVELMSGVFEAELTTSLQITCLFTSVGKNLSQWGRWAALAPKLVFAPQSDDESIEFTSHMRDVTHSRPANFLLAGCGTRHLSSKLEINAFIPLPPSHILPAPQDSYHTTTTHLHLPPPPTKPASRLLRAALTFAIPKHLAN
jgi:hypothetical protein